MSVEDTGNLVYIVQPTNIISLETLAEPLEEMIVGRIRVDLHNRATYFKRQLGELLVETQRIGIAAPWHGPVATNRLKTYLFGMLLRQIENRVL